MWEINTLRCNVSAIFFTKSSVFVTTCYCKHICRPLCISCQERKSVTHRQLLMASSTGDMPFFRVTSPVGKVRLCGVFKRSICPEVNPLWSNRQSSGFPMSISPSSSVFSRHQGSSARLFCSASLLTLTRLKTCMPA